MAKLLIGNKKIIKLYKGNTEIKLSELNNIAYFRKQIQKHDVYLISETKTINSAFTYTFTGKYTNHFTSVYPGEDYRPAYFSTATKGAKFTTTGSHWNTYLAASSTYGWAYYLGEGSVGATSYKIGLAPSAGVITSLFAYFHSLSYDNVTSFPNSKQFSLELTTSNTSFSITTTEQCLFAIPVFNSFPTLATNNSWVNVTFTATNNDNTYTMIDLYAGNTRPYNVANNRFIVLPAGTTTFTFKGGAKAGTPTSNIFAGTIYWIPMSMVKTSLAE